ncbi:hypothetical protein IHE47_14540 [Rhodanobacter sp. DHB23]|nr:hypothetical protein [Rhodanobacter sp. DHB23]
MREKLDELESLTREYARYSRSAGGLSSVLGGACCLLAYLLGGLLPPTPALRIVLVALPLTWLLARRGMERHYYQRFGHVEEQEGAVERRTHRLCIGAALLVAVSVTVSALSHGARLSMGVVAYLALAWLLVLAGWRWLRSPLDFVVGTFLFCQAAVSCAGFAYPVMGTVAAGLDPPMALLALLFPLAALLLIARGVADHRRFRPLCERLLQLRGKAGAA